MFLPTRTNMMLDAAARWVQKIKTRDVNDILILFIN